MQDAVVTKVTDEIIDVSQEKKTETRKKLDSWDYALGMIKVDGLTPSPDVLALVKRERRGEITTKDMLQYLDKKYMAKQRD